MTEALMDALVQVSFAVIARLSVVGSDYDLSLTQLRALAIMRDREPRMAELADHLGLDRSTVSGLIDRSAKRGLAERFADPDDGRASRVRLTPDGHRLARAVEGQLAPELDQLMIDLGEEDRQTLRSLLERAIPG